MAKFDYDKNGYNTEQVDSYITKICLGYENKLAAQKDKLIAMKNEGNILNSTIQDVKNKDKQLSKALMLVVDKTEQYENSFKKIYALEHKRIKLLYNKIYALLDGFDILEEDNKELFDELENIKNSISQMSGGEERISAFNIKEDLKNTDLDYIKNMINKMEYSNVNYKENSIFNEDINALDDDVNSEFEKETFLKTRSNLKNKVENSKQEEKENSGELVNIRIVHNKENDRLKNISKNLNSVIAEKNKKSKNYADEFLNNGDADSDFASSVYAKKIVRKRKSAKDVNPLDFSFPEPNESGFDLKEALNPKDDLDTIMESFNLDDKK